MYVEWSVNEKVAFEVALAASICGVRAMVSMKHIPGDGGTQLLPRMIGEGAALYYLLTGENIPAQEAYRLGLVDKIVPPEQLMLTALAIAKVISRKAPVAVRLVLEAVQRGSEITNYDEYMKVEEELQEVMGDTEDFNEAIKAFIEKRPVVFRGR
jgi:enoyl-CoA hydratase/carnithine racemase